jgi:type VI secretion system protein ImpK
MIDSTNIDVSSLKATFGAFCVDVFNARNFVEQNKEIDYKNLHKSISIVLKRISENEKAPSNKNSNDVSYAMAAIADEIFLNMEWEGKTYWEENMLEFRYFNTQIAGDEIFNKIDELLLKSDPLSIEKAEIYLKILSLGFKGKYRGSDDETVGIDFYRNRLFEFIEKNDRSVLLIGHRFFQKEYTYTMPTIHRKLLPDASIVNYISAFFLFMFLVISSIVWMFETRDLRKLLIEISSIALRE